jgi:hypothetical protein
MLPANFFRNAAAVKHHTKQPLRSRNCQDDPLACQLSAQFFLSLFFNFFIFELLFSSIRLSLIFGFQIP